MAKCKTITIPVLERGGFGKLVLTKKEFKKFAKIKPLVFNPPLIIHLRDYKILKKAGWDMRNFRIARKNA